MYVQPLDLKSSLVHVFGEPFLLTTQLSHSSESSFMDLMLVSVQRQPADPTFPGCRMKRVCLLWFCLIVEVRVSVGFLGACFVSYLKKMQCMLHHFSFHLSVGQVSFTEHCGTLCNWCGVKVTPPFRLEFGCCSFHMARDSPILCPALGRVLSLFPKCRYICVQHLTTVMGDESSSFVKWGDDQQSHSAPNAGLPVVVVSGCTLPFML